MLSNARVCTEVVSCAEETIVSNNNIKMSPVFFMTVFTFERNRKRGVGKDLQRRIAYAYSVIIYSAPSVLALAIA